MTTFITFVPQHDGEMPEKLEVEEPAHVFVMASGWLVVKFKSDGNDVEQWYPPQGIMRVDVITPTVTFGPP